LFIAVIHNKQSKSVNWSHANVLKVRIQDTISTSKFTNLKIILFSFKRSCLGCLILINSKTVNIFRCLMDLMRWGIGQLKIYCWQLTKVLERHCFIALFQNGVPTNKVFKCFSVLLLISCWLPLRVQHSSSVCQVYATSFSCLMFEIINNNN
jgi:hypothetical protein